MLQSASFCRRAMSDKLLKLSDMGYLWRVMGTVLAFFIDIYKQMCSIKGAKGLAGHRAAASSGIVARGVHNL